MKITILVTVVTLLVVSAFGQSRKGHNDTGAGLFRERCIGCHGPDGRAQTEAGKKIGAADLTSDPVQSQSDSNLSNVVRDGKAKMPAFKGKLSSNEIRAVVGYLRELAKKQ
jgi:cytochrome c6